MNQVCQDSLGSLSGNSLQTGRPERRFGTHAVVVATSEFAGSARRTVYVLGVSVAPPRRGFIASQLLLLSVELSVAVHPLHLWPLWTTNAGVGKQ